MPVRKPVLEVSADEMWNYEYQAKSVNEPTILASDSLENLKREVKRRGWSIGYITTSSGALSYGQSVVDEYPYVPRRYN